MTEPRSGRLAAARAERRRVDQPSVPGRVRLPRFDPEAFGRWSETVARYVGTGKFIVQMTVVIVIWFGWNTLAPPSVRFDPYTFTFLTLVLSLQASYAAPLILLAQNRQADRDRLTMEEDRRRATMQKADTEYLAREIASLRIALGEVATRDFLRSEFNRLSEDLGEAADRRSKLDRKEQRRLARRQAELAEHGDAGPADEPLDDEPTDPEPTGGEPPAPPAPATPASTNPPTMGKALPVRAKNGATRDDAGPTRPGHQPKQPENQAAAPKKERRAPQGARRATPTS
jgi:uncharacterized membrane protein